MIAPIVDTSMTSILKHSLLCKDNTEMSNLVPEIFKYKNHILSTLSMLFQVLIQIIVDVTFIELLLKICLDQKKLHLIKIATELKKESSKYDDNLLYTNIMIQKNAELEEQSCNKDLLEYPISFKLHKQNITEQIKKNNESLETDLPNEISDFCLHLLNIKHFISKKIIELLSYIEDLNIKHQKYGLKLTLEISAPIKETLSTFLDNNGYTDSISQLKNSIVLTSDVTAITNSIKKLMEFVTKIKNFINCHYGINIDNIINKSSKVEENTKKHECIDELFTK